MIDHIDSHNATIVDSKSNFVDCLINHRVICDKEHLTFFTPDGPRVILKCMCGYTIVSNHKD